MKKILFGLLLLVSSVVSAQSIYYAPADTGLDATGRVGVSRLVNGKPKLFYRLASAMGGGGGGTWGTITGTLSSQTDLNTALGLKQGTLTNSAGLISALSDETGSGLAVFNNAPSFTAPTIGGVAIPSISSTSTLTNKTMSGASNTFTNIPASAIAASDTSVLDLSIYKQNSDSSALTGFTSIGKFRTDSTNKATLIAAKQAGDADLTTIAGLTATTDNFLVSVSSAWASRTPTQVKTTLALDNVSNTSNATERAATATLSNKRWTARVGNTTSSATPTINTDNVDIYKLTAQAADITSFTTNLTGTPVDGDILEIQITGTAARAITWGASFVSSTVTLPATTVTTATLTVIFQYYTTSSYGNNKWVCANSF